jgi:hypothetical protein
VTSERPRWTISRVLPLSSRTKPSEPASRCILTGFYGSGPSWIPPWVLGVIIMIAPVLVILLVYHWLTRWPIRLAGRLSPFLQRLLERGQGPASVFVVILALGAALPAARFSLPVAIAIGRALLVALILNAGWAAAIAIDISTAIYLRWFHADVGDNLLARKHVTQMRILQRVATTLLVILTVASSLMTFDSVRQYGSACSRQPATPTVERLSIAEQTCRDTSNHRAGTASLNPASNGPATAVPSPTRSS